MFNYSAAHPNDRSTNKCPGEVMKPISKTAYYTCGLRMDDAAAENPICGDSFAKEFMNDEGLQIFDRFRYNTDGNIPVLYRHRIMDEVIQDFIDNNPDGQIILLGAGFDSRPYRLHGGRWIEVDEPQIISYKNSCLPPEKCPNHVERIAADFHDNSFHEKLAVFSGVKNTLIVIEGVFVYLEKHEIINLLKSLKALFPGHSMLCDLLSIKYFNRYCLDWHKAFEDTGSSFRITTSRPEKNIIDYGYRVGEKLSVITRAVEDGRYGRPVALIRVLVSIVHRHAVNGYHIFLFDAPSL